MLRPSHSPDTSASGFVLLTSINSNPPWLDAGALRCNVVPGVQVLATFALAPAGSSAAVATIHAKPHRNCRLQTAVIACQLSSPAPAPPLALHHFPTLHA